MGDNRELRIKMTIDNADAVRGVDEFGSHADKATARGADGMRRVEQSTKDATESAKGMKGALGGVNNEIASLIRAQIGLNAFKGLASAIGSEWQRVADDISKASKEWQQFRASLQGIASLEGKGNTNRFAEAEIARAERARVLPAEAQQFREAFLAKASLYVGNGAAAKMSTEDADELQTMLMEYAKQKGVQQKDMAGFAGGLLAQQKGKISGKDMMARVGKTFATLEASSADVSHLLPAMTRVMAQGMSAEDASRTLAGMPEIAPEEESTHLLDVLAEIRRLNVEGKGKAFGIEEGATPQQQLEGMVANLKQRSGGNAKRLDTLLREATPNHIAADTLRGMVEKMDFAQWKRVQEDVPDDQLRRTIAEGRGHESGRQYAIDSRLAVEKARMGMRNDAIERRRQIAETELTKAGEFERVNYGQLTAEPLRLAGAADMKHRLINQQMIARARSELGEGVSAADKGRSLYDQTTNELMKDLIRRIDAQHAELQKQTRLMEQKGGHAGAPPPMGGRPARIPVRPGA